MRTLKSLYQKAKTNDGILQMKDYIRLLLSTFFLCGAVIFLAHCSWLTGPFTGPGDIRVLNPNQAVSDARELILETRKLDKGSFDYPRMLKISELPESLRIPRVLHCFVYDDHLELVLARNPDIEIGARIWSADSTKKHTDKPTKYPEIFFFIYNNDLPESQDNTP